MSRERGQPVAPIDAPVVDAHTHTYSREFRDDYDATLTRAWNAGLVAMVEVGGDLDSSRQCLALAQASPRIHAVAGIHPHEAREFAAQRDALRDLVHAGGFVGIGEIGLDFFRNLSPPEAQYEAFQQQLELAREASLPVVIHARNADEEAYTVIQEWALRVGPYRGADAPIGMMHCFTGDRDLAARYVRLGFCISVPGPVTYPPNREMQEVARALPMDRMLVETDSPYLTPMPYRGGRNEPSYVVETVRYVAALRDVSPEAIARTTAENAARLFGFTLRPDARTPGTARTA